MLMFLYFYMFQQKLKYMCLQYLSSLFPYPYLQHTHTHPTDIHPICVCVSSSVLDCSLPGSFVHGISPNKDIGVGQPFPSPGLFLTQGLKPGSLLCHLSHSGKSMPPFVHVQLQSLILLLQ